jgi:hypothetical protein
MIAIPKPGTAYWLGVLASHAEAGYRHGVVTAEEVLLIHETSGAEVRLASTLGRRLGGGIAGRASDWGRRRG